MKKFLITFLNKKYSKFPLGLLFFYILVLFQASFLIHFDVFLEGFAGYIPNLTLIAVILVNVFEHPPKNLGIFSGFAGGFFLDVFSEHFFGFYVLILAGLAMVLKFILRNYVRFPIIKRI